MGRIDAWDELSLFGIWDELSLGTNCRLGRIVAQPKWSTSRKAEKILKLSVYYVNWSLLQNDRGKKTKVNESMWNVRRKNFYRGTTWEENHH